MKFAFSGVAATAFVLGSITLADPAAALTFRTGDTLNITGAVDIQGQTHLFKDVAGITQSLGNYGNFGVNASSTGAFSSFVNGGLVVEDYEILSLDFANSATYLGVNFLNVTNGTDSFAFEIKAPVNALSVVSNQGFAGTAYEMSGIFKDVSTGEVVARAIFTANDFGANGTFSGTFAVVPEPATALALIPFAGLAIARRRRQGQPAD